MGSMDDEGRESKIESPANFPAAARRRDTIGAIPADRNSGKKAANWPPLDLG